MRLTVLQQGRLRDPAVVALCAEYRKRFQRFGTLSVLEVEPKGDAPMWPKSARWKVALDERGPFPTSIGLSDLLQKWTMAHGEVCFAIGDAMTLHPPTLATADGTLGLSALTLPHQFAHLLLIEQLYRAATIQAGTGYHHA